MVFFLQITEIVSVVSEVSAWTFDIGTPLPFFFKLEVEVVIAGTWAHQHILSLDTLEFS